MAAPLTEAAIQQVRHLIATGQLVPGQRLPPEPELADSLGTSRSTVREAVRALVTARVLDVRRGDGTFVTSLRPELLLAGIGAAADLLQGGFTLELIEVRRILEPAATRLAATRIGAETLAELEACLHRMSAAGSQDELVQYD
jgi:GntR family transcriptional repressor for pyruvate dehydrogenase complex